MQRKAKTQANLESLHLAAHINMVRISTIRDSNAQCKCLDGLVAVFVGGTGGIGESTATEFFMRTTRPRAYIVGRWVLKRIFGARPPLTS